MRTLGLDPDVDAEGTEVRRRCGVVPARPALYDRLSRHRQPRVRGRALRGRPARSSTRASPRRPSASASPTRSHLKVGGYSTGMRARLALARAVLHEPDLLLLDEPTAGLDPESARAVLGLIDEMAEDGKTVLMCTHLLLEAEGLADQVVVMDHGQRDGRRARRASSPAGTGPRRVSCSTPTTPRCSTPPAACRSCARTSATASRPSTSSDETDVPDLVDALVGAGARLTPRRAAGPEPRRAVLRDPPGEPASRRP